MPQSSIPSANPLPLSSLSRGDVIEVQGGPASGKTHLLYYLVCSCILPVRFGGWNKAAVIYDADQTFDVRRLHQLLCARIISTFTQSHDETQIAIVVATAMRNLQIFAVSSIVQLIASMSELPTYHAEHMPTSEIALLGIDSMSAFYWQERFATEKQRFALQANRTNSERFTDLLQHVFAVLDGIHSKYGSLIVLTSWGFWQQDVTTPSAHPQFNRQLHSLFPQLPSAVQARISPALTHRILLHRTHPKARPSSTLPTTLPAQRTDGHPPFTQIDGYVLIPDGGVIDGSFSCMINPDGLIHFTDSLQ